MAPLTSSLVLVRSVPARPAHLLVTKYVDAALSRRCGLDHSDQRLWPPWEGPLPQPKTARWPTIDEDPFPPSQTAYDALRYEVSLAVSDDSDVIQVEVAGDVWWMQLGAEAFVLDLASDNFEVSELRLDGELQQDFVHDDDKVTVLGLLPRGSPQGTFSIRYSGIPLDGMVISETKFGARCFFTDHWPNRAHQWLASNDHPADKAMVTFSVTAPSHYDVIASGLLQQNVTDSSKADGGGGASLRTHVWSSEIKMSTKVIAVGIAEFAIDEDESGFSVPTASYVYPENEEAGFEDYSGGGPIMETLQSIFGVFPYEKNVHVQSKTIYGASSVCACFVTRARVEAHALRCVAPAGAVAVHRRRVRHFSPCLCAAPARADVPAAVLLLCVLS